MHTAIFRIVSISDQSRYQWAAMCFKGFGLTLYWQFFMKGFRSWKAQSAHNINDKYDDKKIFYLFVALLSASTLIL